MKIGFIGLGKLGLPVALAIENKGHTVFGYDVNPDVKKYIEEKKIPYTEKGTPELLEKTKIKIVSLDEVISSSEVVFCPVQTPHHSMYEGTTRVPDMRVDFDYSYLKQAVKDIADSCERQSKHIVLVVISTCLPGTYKREIKPLLNRFIKYAYSPLYIAMGTTRADFEHPEFSLLGIEDLEASNTLKSIYRTIHNSPIFETDITTAEAIKVFYNTFITSKILLANTWMQVAHKLGMNVDDISKALSLATDRVISSKYMRGGGPDAGGCHPRDLIALSWLGQQIDLKPNYFEIMVKAREAQTEWTADLLEAEVKRTGLDLIILGKAFKPETNLTVGSGATLLKNILDERAIKSEQYDPIVDTDIPELRKAIYIVATEHKVFADYKFPEGSIVYDLWRSIPEQDGVKVVHIGDTNVENKTKITYGD